LEVLDGAKVTDVARRYGVTALSRGIERDDLYVASLDRRDDERHAPEQASDSDVVVHVARRSTAQGLAVDHANDRLTPIADLEAERFSLVTRLNAGPEDPTTELRDIQHRLGQRRRDRDDAAQRRDRARTGLEDLGPVGRRLHRQDRHRLERARDQATDDLARADTDIAHLADRANELAEPIKTWKQWRTDHRSELQRQADLYRVITDRRVELTIERSHSAEIEADLGISL
jgi:hypothetical protein